MVRWTVVGSLGAVFVSMGLHAVAQHAPRPRTASVPELSVSGLRTGTAATPRGPVDPSVRIRTSGIPCILSSGVRRLPEHVELRVDGQVRRVPIRNTIEHAGQAVGEVVVPYPLLDGVDWRLSDVTVETADGATVGLAFDRSTGGCVAHLPVAPQERSVDIRCPVRGDAVAPPVRRLYVWDQDLFPSHWAAPSAASERDAFVLMDVAPTGTAELDVGLESHLLVRWRDGVCAEVSVDLDVELCVQVSEGDLLYDDPSFRLYIDDMLAPLDGEGVGCAATRVGDSLVTQVWMTETSAREHTDLFSVATPGEHRVEIARHLLDTASGAVLWPSVFGPRVVSVRGLAEAMGVRNGDVVVAVNGQSVAGEPMAEVAEHLDGLHSSVVLTLDRADVELDITILFDEVDD